jgi:hypothetical protein
MFTKEENNWLNRRVSKLEETWGSVSLGEDHLREFVMWSFDVPVGKNFFRNAIASFNERFRKVMKMHHQFRNLPDHIQSKLWERNSFFGAALNVAKLETCKTGEDQLKCAYGKSDKNLVANIFETEMRNNFSVKSLKVLLISHTNHNHDLDKIPGSMKLINRYTQLVKNVIPILHNESLFYPFILLMLFSDVSDTELQNCTELQNLSQHYSTIIQRKLLYNNGKFRENDALTDKTGTGNDDETETGNDPDESEQLEFGRRAYFEINSYVRDAKELSQVLQKIIAMNANAATQNTSD